MTARITGLILMLISFNGYWPISYHLHCNYKDNAGGLIQCVLSPQFYIFSLSSHHFRRIQKADFNTYRESKKKRTYYQPFLVVNEGSVFKLYLYTRDYNELNRLISSLNTYLFLGERKDLEISRLSYNGVFSEVLTIFLFIISLLLILLGDKFEILVNAVSRIFGYKP